MKSAGLPLLATAIAAASLFCGSATRVLAQQEFTKQMLLIPDFEGPNRGLAKKAADVVRSQMARGSNKREVEIVDQGDVETMLEKSGFNTDSSVMPSVRKTLIQRFRADEYLTGVVDRTKEGQVRIVARLILTRDEHMQQPLPAAIAGNVDAAATQLATSLRAARGQSMPQRRCENALRDGKLDRAMVAAREGIAAYPRSTITRACLLSAMINSGVAADSILSVARQILEVDPVNFRGLEGAALAHDAIGQRERAGEMWSRLVATDSDDVALVQHVVNALMSGGNNKIAEPLISRAAAMHPDSLQLVLLHSRVAYANRSWRAVIKTSEQLLAADSALSSLTVDSTLFLRLATAYKADSQPVKAVSVAARGVAAYPKDPKMYLLYTQLVRAEAEATLPRGLALFPKSAELLVLQAQEAKRAGNSKDALAASAKALELDPMLTHGYLQLAETQAVMGMIDSAYASLKKALAHKEDTALVAQAALSRGNALYKAANVTKSRDDYVRAMPFFMLADTLRPTPQSKFLRGATALSIAQSAASDAPKLKSCDLSKMAEDMLPVAQLGISQGGSIAPDAAKQYLDYIDQLVPIVQSQVKALCKN